MMTKTRRFTMGLAIVLTAAACALMPGAFGRGHGHAQTREENQPTAQEPQPAAGGNGAIADATRVGDAVATVAQRVSPSVVTLLVETPRQNPMAGFPFGPRGGGGDSQIATGNGSGVIIRGDGYILTNNHVVENAIRIDVVLQDGRHLPATVVGTDTATDLAVVRVSARGLPAADWGDSDAARVGEWVVAIGAPFGLDYTVTAGVLSATGRGIGANEIEDYLQTDASINPGNSGGPLVNLHGQILGINTMIIGRGSGIGFAIPSSMAHLVADQLIQNGVVRRAYVGVGFQELTPELAGHFRAPGGHGALVNHVEAGGPAERAGLEEGDIILSVGNVTVREGRDLLREVIRRPVGANVQLSVLRNGRRRSFTVTTAERPNQQPQRPPPRPAVQPRGHGHGAQLRPLNPQIRRQIGYAGPGDVVVARVQSGSAAERAGLRAGDVILRADRKPVSAPRIVDEALAGDHEALLRVQRRDRRFFTVLSTR